MKISSASIAQSPHDRPYKKVIQFPIPMKLPCREQSQTMPDKNLTGWCLTNGHVGNEEQAIGVLEELGIEPVVKRVNPKGPYRWIAPFGPAMKDHNIAPPWPDILVASSRVSAPYARSIRRRSNNKTFVVLLQDSGAPPSWFNFVWVNTHDRLTGDNVMKTLTTPHRVTNQRLQQDATLLEKRIAPLAGPYLSVLLGGPSNAYEFPTREAKELAVALAAYAKKQKLAVLVTSSRRTTPDQTEAFRSALAAIPHWIWDGSGDNPYFGMLGLASEVHATCDSVNMVSEACFTGKPVHMLKLEGGARKFHTFQREIIATGAVKWFDGTVASSATYPPINARHEIAEEIGRRFSEFRKKINEKSC